MERLERLLNKFEKETKNNEGVVRREYMELDNSINCYVFDKLIDFSELLLISKEYKFIEWLVEKDKINTESWPLCWFKPIMNNRQPYSLYECVLMFLSIEEKPIDLLISIIK